ncbi:MAG: hypothetical protein DYG92_09405 [Leptolyngbya sp. PLA1]|nr:hypothetical protein [Leptolyngbya sp. PLA1]
MDETTPLCESCGYDLSASAPSGSCPECGALVAASLPGSRIGSPWQQRPGLLAWGLTNLGTLLRPADRFRSLRISYAGAPTLLAANLLLAGAVMADPWVGATTFDPARSVRDFSNPSQLALYAAVWLAWSLLAALLLLVLTCVEYAGVRFFAARQEWRLTRPAALQVCAHASIGWVLCGVLAIAAMVVPQILIRYFHLALDQRWDLRPAIAYTLDLQTILMVALPSAGYLAGLLLFEWLVFRGVRACRFAAREPRTDTPLPTLS